MMISRLLHVAFEEMCFCGKKAWVSNLYYPGIYCIDLESHEVSLEAFLDERFVAGSHTSIAYYDHRLILAPNNSTSILIYDLNDKCFIKDIDVSGQIETETNQLFKQIIIRGEKAYLIPGKANVILVLDLRDYSIKSIDLSTSGFKKYIHEKNRIAFRRGAFNNVGELMLPCFQDAKIIVIELNGNIKIQDLGNEPLTDICEYKESFYVLMREKPRIIQFDKKGNVLDVIEVSCVESGNISGLSKGILIGNEYYLAPRLGDSILKINLDTKEIKKVADLPVHYTADYLDIGTINVLGFFESDGKIWCDSCRDSSMIGYDYFMKKVESIDLVVNDIARNDICRKMVYQVSKEGLLKEAEGVSLDLLLGCV